MSSITHNGSSRMKSSKSDNTSLHEKTGKGHRGMGPGSSPSYGGSYSHPRRGNGGYRGGHHGGHHGGHQSYHQNSRDYYQGGYGHHSHHHQHHHPQQQQHQAQQRQLSPSNPAGSAAERVTPDHEELVRFVEESKKEDVL